MLVNWQSANRVVGAIRSSVVAVDWQRSERALRSLCALAWSAMRKSGFTREHALNYSVVGALIGALIIAVCLVENSVDAFVMDVPSDEGTVNRGAGIGATSGDGEPLILSTWIEDYEGFARANCPDQYGCGLLWAEWLRADDFVREYMSGDPGASGSDVLVAFIDDVVGRSGEGMPRLYGAVDDCGYEVRPNDGWSVIAKRIGMKMNDLLALNDKTVGDIIHPGDCVRTPK